MRHRPAVDRLRSGRGDKGRPWRGCARPRPTALRARPRRTPMRPSAVRRRRTAPGNGTRPSARESRRSSPRIRGDSVAEQVRRLAPSRSRLWCVSPLVASVRPEAVTGDGDPDCHGLAGPGPEHLVRYRHLPLLTSLDGVDVTTLAASPRTGSTRGSAPQIVGGSRSGGLTLPAASSSRGGYGRRRATRSPA